MPGWSWRPIAAGLFVILGLSACGTDADQVRLCGRAISAVESDRGRVEILAGRADPRSLSTVIVTYRFAGGAPGDLEGRCRFSGARLDRDRLVLEQVTTGDGEPLSPARLQMLRAWLGLFTAQRGATPQVRADGTISAPTGVLYFGQQLVNAAVASTVYVLLAIGYTLIWGILRRINLAFGELAMVGGFTAFLTLSALAVTEAAALGAAIAVTLLVAMAIGAVHGLGTERLIFRPLSRSDTQAPLIATIGLAMALQEYVRLTQGAEDRWLQPLFAWQHRIAENEAFALSITTGQMMVLALAGVLCIAVALLLRRTGFGLHYRACADDAAMAGLLGVDVRRTVSGTFLLAGALAAAAGFIVATHYGGVNFFMGVMLGFKALTAAILGGIGSVAGAVLGGILLGLIETLWDGYLVLAWRDVATFSILALVLIFRPEGLLGRRLVRNI